MTEFNVTVVDTMIYDLIPPKEGSHQKDNATIAYHDC